MTELSMAALLLGGLLFFGPAQPPKTKAPAEKALGCSLVTPEVPRGGRLEVRGENPGRSPLVRLSGKVLRIIERQGDTIAVQVPRDAKDGEVVLQSGKERASCGTLKIIGTD
ncbi:MAG: hypothetical protein OEZ06_04490 [Myxococcales bacterium]|nr:hypothetical protein [Myxococcales bacterium]